MIPALTAAAVTGIVLAVRWIALHRHGRGAGLSETRPVWRHTSHGPGRAAAGVVSPAAAPPDEAAWSAVREAEQHVHRCWERLQKRVAPPD